MKHLQRQVMSQSRPSHHFVSLRESCRWTLPLYEKRNIELLVVLFFECSKSEFVCSPCKNWARLRVRVRAPSTALGVPCSSGECWLRIEVSGLFVCLFVYSIDNTEMEQFNRSLHSQCMDLIFHVFNPYLG